MQLRAELRIDEFCSLSQEQAFELISDCEIHAVTNVEGIRFETLLEFHTEGQHVGAFAFKIGRGLKIVFNDAYPVTAVRVHIMDEFFHLRLGHPPDTVRIYALDGRSRTHNPKNDDEAYGCAIAALVPFSGLLDMPARGLHISRIAEHFVVPVSVVEERIAATDLGHLASTSTQLRLLV
jgi:IrrE N-terminal-like domain